MKKIRGFSSKAGPYIARHPGLTAQDIVRSLLRSGEVQSAAENPEGSLVATLHKHHKEIGVERRRDGGVYRYYPNDDGAGLRANASLAQAGSDSQNDDVVVTVRLRRAVADIADVLVASGKCQTRSHAVTWLIERGISSTRL